MEQVIITIKQSEVYDEVDKSSGYSGAKSTEDDAEKAYERISVTTADHAQLDRYWQEACSIATGCMQQFIDSVTTSWKESSGDASTGYQATLGLPSCYDTQLNGAVQASLFSFFVNYILSKWYMAANKQDVEAYSTEAAAMLASVRAKIYYRKRPERIKPAIAAKDHTVDGYTELDSSSDD